MKVNVFKATNLQLDWMVAKCLTLDASNGDEKLVALIDYRQMGSPSTDWAQGGPIIDREGLELSVHCMHNGVITSWACEKDWPSKQVQDACGPTPLIAAMRCYVASKLGAEVEVPDELT